MSWPKIRKIVILKSHRLLLCTTTANHFFFQLWHATKADFIQQLAMTSSVVGLRSTTKALPKAKLAAKQGHGHCLVACYPSNPVQLSESWWNHYIWEIYSANWWDAPKTTPIASTGQQKGPNFFSTTMSWPHVTQPKFQKLNELGYKVLPHSPYSPDLPPTDYHFFKYLNNTLQRKGFHNQQEAENAFWEFAEFWNMDFYVTGVNKHFLLAKLCRL